MWYQLRPDRTTEPCGVGELQWDAPERIVARDEHLAPGDATVSTVFLGLDHNFGFDGPPILFETLVFGGPLDGEMRRYATWDEAVVGHAEMLARVRGAAVQPTAAPETPADILRLLVEYGSWYHSAIELGFSCDGEELLERAERALAAEIPGARPDATGEP